RALDKYRKHKGKEQMSFKDCAYIDGGGNSFVERAVKIKEAKLQPVIFCDSDDPAINAKKENLKAVGIDLFDCDAEKCIEVQVFQDLPWIAIKELVQYVLVVHKNNDQNAFEASIK